jgi:hypothetical protein
MAKLNGKAKTNKTTNKSGGVAYKQSYKMLLVSQVLCSFYNESKFYGDNSAEIIENAKQVIQNSDEDALFVSKLCMYARKEFNMRTISQVLAVVLANEENGIKYAKDTISNVCLRVDDITNIVAFQLNEYGHTIPNQMKKGLSIAFNKFDEYQFAKYNRKGEVKLRDALRLTHPKPKDENQSELFKKILNDNLETPYTWEVELSTKGNTKEVWEELISSKRLGYMATLRNLRNILTAKVDNIQDVYNYIENENAIKNSKQLPFRYYSAYKEIDKRGLGTNKTYSVLSNALQKSLNNIETLKGLSFICGDESGSMNCGISFKSDITCKDISNLMVAMANYICEDSITGLFADGFRIVSMNKNNSVLSNALSIQNHQGGTNINSTVKYLLDKNIKVDRIIIFSDNEANEQYTSLGWGWGERINKTTQQLFDEYRRKINHNCWLHAIDLEGYGTVQFNEYDNHVNLIAGWSEKLLNFIPLVERGADGIVKEIENYEF